MAEHIVESPSVEANPVAVAETMENSPAAIGIKLKTNGATKEDINRQLVVAALYSNQGSRTKAAKQLGISRRTFHRYLASLDLGSSSRSLSSAKRGDKKCKSIYHQNDEYFNAIEKEGQKAIAIMDLENEVTLLRAHTLELLRKFRDGTAIGSYDRGGAGRPATDVERAGMIARLTQAIATVRKTDYDMLRENVISVANFKIWLAKLAFEIKAEFPDIGDQKKFCKAAALAGEPTRGESKE